MTKDTPNYTILSSEGKVSANESILPNSTADFGSLLQSPCVCSSPTEKERLEITDIAVTRFWISSCLKPVTLCDKPIAHQSLHKKSKPSNVAHGFDYHGYRPQYYIFYPIYVANPSKGDTLSYDSYFSLIECLVVSTMSLIHRQYPKGKANETRAVQGGACFSFPFSAIWTWQENYSQNPL